MACRYPDRPSRCGGAQVVDGIVEAKRVRSAGREQKCCSQISCSRLGQPRAPASFPWRRWRRAGDVRLFTVPGETPILTRVPEYSHAAQANHPAKVTNCSPVSPGLREEPRPWFFEGDLLSLSTSVCLSAHTHALSVHHPSPSINV